MPKDIHTMGEVEHRTAWVERDKQGKVSCPRTHIPQEQSNIELLGWRETRRVKCLA